MSGSSSASSTRIVTSIDVGKARLLPRVPGKSCAGRPARRFNALSVTVPFQTNSYNPMSIPYAPIRSIATPRPEFGNKTIQSNTPRKTMTTTRQPPRPFRSFPACRASTRSSWPTWSRPCAACWTPWRHHRAPAGRPHAAHLGQLSSNPSKTMAKRLGCAWGIAAHMHSVMDTPEWREATTSCCRRSPVLRRISQNLKLLKNINRSE